MRIHHPLLITAATLVTLLACNDGAEPRKQEAAVTAINTAHLERLTIPVMLRGEDSAAGIYIYSEAPDYKLVDDSDEGFTCVDDVSRAALFYLRQKAFTADTALQRKASALLRFVLGMQAPNGYFYNFVLPGNVINKTHQTSRAEPNWWSWRALHTLTEAVPLLQKTDAALVKRMEAAISRLLIPVSKDLAALPATTRKVQGITIPQWLPAGSGTDQAALLLIGLINHCTAHPSDSLKAYIRKLADGIVLMQQGDRNKFPYACILSWENTWHAYGSDGAYALFKAGSFLNDSTYTNTALKEVSHFYPWLLAQGQKASFAVVQKGDSLQMANVQQYAQIAYGIRPMIFAALEAHRLTGKVEFSTLAAQLAAWFYGENETNTAMYDEASGRCFDGIVSAGSINRNSGAESTIEALLALQMLEADPQALTALNEWRRTEGQSSKK